MADDPLPTCEQPTLAAEPVPPPGQPTLVLEPGAAPAATVPEGDCFGDYVLLQELGRGGMGVVYKAFEPGLDRYVAVKMILAGALPGEQELHRFRTEASAAGRLQHPNIVKVHRVGTVGERHYYSMDLIDGASLAQKLADGPLPGRVAARYLLTIARAIQHAHEQGILHRDLKPGNILIDRHDQPHVTDFGLAKQLSADDGQTRTGALMGTPSYMSPEQAAGRKDVGPATDVYGLGALLYELVTHRPPFRGETTLDTVMQVMEHDPAPPRLLNPRIDRDLETIVLKCLAKDPRDRYPSAAALADDLALYLQGESIHARSMNMIDYIGRTLERSQFDIEFRPYGNLILTFAAVVALMHVVKHFLISYHQPFWSVLLAHVAQFGLMALAVWIERPKGFLPTTPAERLLWSVWVAYILACVLIGQLTRVMLGSELVYQKIVYPYYAVITGFAFFVLGSSYWGRLYGMAIAFFALAFVMQLDLYWATLEFGAAWVVALCLIGFHLRRLGAQRGQTEGADQTST